MSMQVLTAGFVHCPCLKGPVLYERQGNLAIHKVKDREVRVYGPLITPMEIRCPVCGKWTRTLLD